MAVPPVPNLKEHKNTLVLICPYCDYNLPGAPMESGAIGCGNCGNPFEVEVTRTATGKRIKDNYNHEYDEYIRTYTSRQVKILTRKPIDQIETVEEATQLFNAGLLTAEELKNLSLSKKDVVFWNLQTDRNPFSPEGDHKAREKGAIYNPSLHPKGIIFQHVIKESIRNFMDFVYGSLKSIYGKDKAKTGFFKKWVLKRLLKIAPGMLDYANSMITTHYDKDAFVFEDPFLKAIHDLAHEHISENFQWDYPWVDERMRKGVDLMLVVLNEDMPYRAKAKLWFDDLIKRYPNGFTLTESEIEANRLSNEDGARIKRGEPYKGIKPSFIKS